MACETPASTGGAPAMGLPLGTASGAAGADENYDKDEVLNWILDLNDPKKREMALLELR